MRNMKGGDVERICLGNINRREVNKVKSLLAKMRKVGRMKILKQDLVMANMSSRCNPPCNCRCNCHP